MGNIFCTNKKIASKYKLIRYKIIQISKYKNKLKNCTCCG